MIEEVDPSGVPAVTGSASKEKMLRVLIDATCVTRNKGGVGIYAKNLIQELVQLDSGIQLFLLVQSDDPELHFGSLNNVRTIRVPSFLFRNRAIRILLEQVYLPILLKLKRINVLHSLHYSFPFLRLGTYQVVTIHDMTSFQMPEVHESSKVVYFQTFIKAAARFADKIIFVSSSAQDDFTKRFAPRTPPSVVIHLGKSAEFRSNLAAALIEKIRDKYALPERYILYVGTLEPRKNLIRLVEAFAKVSAQHPDCKLVLAGMKGWMTDDLFQLVSRLDLQSKVILTGFVPEEEKPLLIAGATVFAYPSLYEGFGIPVLEALSCGIPTLTSNVSSLPEVAGDGALYVDPLQTAEISAALDRLLSDQALRTDLRLKAIHQASRFSWKKTAFETLRTYKEATVSN